RQLDANAAALLKRTLERRGLRILLGANTSEILGEKRVTGVRLADGTQIPADLVVMAAGVRPNAELARAAGLHCERAIVVDDTLQTYDPRIYAVGECVQHRQATFGLVAPIWDQARVCAAHLAGAGHRRY
ncbi:FAD-dependent oxidoreductase, partial [Salmonella enterica]|nr:FAD-dependent oxidoreductase [Salmonella enterica]